MRRLAVVALVCAALAAFAACGGGQPPPPGARDACRQVIAALDGARDRAPPGPLVESIADAGADDFEARAQAIDDERRAVERAGLPDDGAGTVARHGARASEASAALRKLSGYVHTTVQQDVLDFGEAMSSFMSQCTAPECVDIIMLIGAHTMHQGRLDQTLPLLADKLAAMKLSDPKMQAELDRFIAATRRAGESYGDAMSAPDRVGDAIADVKRRLAALDEARSALRARCAK